MEPERRQDLPDQGLSREIGRACACFNLRRAARIVTQRYDRALKDVGLKGTQLSVLMAALNQRDVQLTRLAKSLGMERTSLTRTLAVLERRGLVETQPGRDRRERQIKLTPEGEETLRRALPLWRQAQEEVIAALGQGQWEGLLGGLHQVVRKLR